MSPQTLAQPTRELVFAAASASTQRLYDELLKAVAVLGPVEEEWKKTCVHLVRKSAFAGVHPRKHALILTIKSASPIESARIIKSDQTSKSRWHLDVRLEHPEDIDSELLGWLRAAYQLCG